MGQYLLTFQKFGYILYAFHIQKIYASHTFSPEILVYRYMIGMQRKKLKPLCTQYIDI